MSPSSVAGQELRSLFRAFMRESSKYPNYNIREYIRRRAREEFRRSPKESGEDITAIKADLDVVKRQGIVYSLYSRGSKSVMDLPKAA
ncbi:hypothetical protein M9434_006421 [Picochlorum sp. BPE23]|nr:hypothetical protein M9434_006421 [Picochlorum sp. BPE23]KAI8109068.1 hypothetical protein M9435_005484 [Picochlorum sp. BPE23]|mmetsp:Transcript_7457/g.14963  ORF Transcript_7457/g.14963 Transcript_7457/m.14963 type:complete len:88 (-) Transcript_7457:450-713(-)|eukprot:jgi/Picre1/35658/NNA_003119.t1